MTDLRCIHRHTIREHPKCFANGLLRETKKEKVEENSNSPWYEKQGLKICYFDIESDGLKADFSTMLSWAVKAKDGPVVVDNVTKEELFNGTTDQRIIKSLIEELKKYDVIVGYFSTGFDLPYIRSKALHYNLDFIDYGEIIHWDIFYTVKSKLNLSRKSLDSACDYLGIKGKTPIDKEVWRKAKYGDPESIQEVISHNIGDVIILEKLHNRLSNFRKWTKTSA